MGRRALAETAETSSSETQQSGAVAPIVLTQEEGEIFQKLISTPESPEQAIPDDIQPNDLWRYLTTTAKAIIKAEQVSARLKPFLGRQLLLLKQHPDLYERHGFVNWNDFMTSGVQKLFGISRAEAYNCTKIGRTLDFMSAEKMEVLGFSKLNVIATALNRSTTKDMPIEMVEEKRRVWTQRAETGTVQELREQMEQDHLIEKGEGQKVPLVVTVNPEIKKQWTEFVASAEIQAFCQTDDPGTILARMIEEVSTEWLAQANESLRSK